VRAFLHGIRGDLPPVRRPCAMAHHALTYHRSILPRLEARSKLENMIGFSLRMLLRQWSAKSSALGEHRHNAYRNLRSNS
jgi:hypothetical protein